MEPGIALQAIELTKIIENGLLSCMFTYAINSYTDSSALLIKSMEKCGIKVSDTNANKILNIIDSALRMTYSGSLKHDKSNNIISIQSKIDRKPVLPWAILLNSYFNHIGNESKIMHNSEQDSNAEIIHIKLSKPIF
jgi:hypothetical protein